MEAYRYLATFCFLALLGLCSAALDEDVRDLQAVAASLVAKDIQIQKEVKSNYQRVLTELEDLEERIEDLEKAPAAVRPTPTPWTRATTRSTSRSPRSNCDYVAYGGKCFKPIWGRNKVPHYAVPGVCTARNMRVANIYSKAHYDKVTSTIRTEMIAAGVEQVTLWIGLRARNSIQGVVTRDGALAPYLKWYPGHPESYYWNQYLALVVHESASSRQQGMFTTEYLETVVQNVLCESK